MQRYQVEVRSLPDDATASIAALRTVGALTLADAAAIYRHAVETPATVVVVAGVERSVADHIVATLRAVGAEVDAVESASTTPMVCRPEAAVAYRWTVLRSLVRVSTTTDDEGNRE